MNSIFYWLNEDESNEVVSTALDCIKELLESVGPIIIENYIPDLIKSLKSLLNN